MWTALPFVLRNAPPRYSRLANRECGGLELTGTFIDEDNISCDLRAFLDRCLALKLKSKPKYVFIGFQQLEFLEFNRMSTEGFVVLKEKSNR